MISRRRFLAGSMLVGATAVGPGLRWTRAQAATPPGKIAFVRSGSIWSWQGGNAAALFEDGAVSDSRWSPDGNQVLFVRAGNSFSDLYTRTLADGSETQLTFNEVTGYDPGSKEYADNSIWVVDPCWSASGAIAYASDYYTPYGVLALWVMSYPGATPSMYLSDPGDQSIEGVTLSGDGSFAAYTSRQASEETSEYVSFVAIQDLGNGESRPLVEEPGGAFDPAISPDGTRIAVAIRSGGFTDVWIIERDTGERTQVTSGANAAKPCWSSDGSWLAFIQMVNFKFEAHAVSISGTQIGENQMLFEFDDFDAPSGLSWHVS